MKESKYSIDSRIIFKETFNSEQETRKNGGVPTDVSYSKGIGSFNGSSSIITYPTIYNLTEFSVIIKKVKFSNISASVEMILSGTQSGEYLFGISNITVYFNNSTTYVNSLHNLTLNNTDEYDLVVIRNNTIIKWYINGDLINSSTLSDNNPSTFNKIGKREGFVAYFNGDIDLIEIYNTVLTASEVKNLYENKTYHELPDKVAEQLGDELITNGGFDNNDNDWFFAIGDSKEWQSGGYERVIISVYTDHLYQTSVLNPNIKYFVSCRARTVSGNTTLHPHSYKAAVGEWGSGILTSNWSNFTFTYTPSDPATNWVGFGLAGVGVFEIDDILVKEIISGTGIEKILDVSAISGVLESKYTDITNTDITATKTSNYYTMLFNGAAKGVFGNIGTVGTLNLILFYDGTDQDGIIDLNGGTNTVEHAGGTLAYWGDNAYINGVDTDTLSYGWNYITIIDNTGTSASAFQIGYNDSDYFTGKIGRCQCFTGNISLAQHTQFWSNNKRYFE